jgi:hypothetical protein
MEGRADLVAQFEAPFQIGAAAPPLPGHQIALPAPAVRQVLAEDVARLVAKRQRFIELRDRDLQIAVPAAHHAGEKHARRLSWQVLDLAPSLIPWAAANAASNSPCMP